MGQPRSSCRIVLPSEEVKRQLDEGKSLDEIEVDFRLTVLRPLHAQWLIAIVNHFTSEKGKPIFKGWKRLGISGTQELFFLLLILSSNLMSNCMLFYS